MQDDIRRLEDKIDALTALVLEKVKPVQIARAFLSSLTTAELMKALSIAQKSYKPIVDLSINPYSEQAYASMQRVVDATREPLCENGLTVTQVFFDHDYEILHTRLGHSSGEFIESQMIVRANGNDPVALTSYKNWLKRIAYCGIVGCPIPKEDDDAVKYNESLGDKVALRGSAAKKKNESHEFINQTQYDEIILELEGYPDLAQMVLDQLEIESFKEMRQSQFPNAIKGIREEKFKMKIR